MKRWARFFLCFFVGSLLLIAGLLLPAHWRAVNSRVLAAAGADTSSLVDVGMEAVRHRNFGLAEWLWLAAQPRNVAGHETLYSSIKEVTRSYPEALLGVETHLDPLLSLKTLDREATQVSRFNSFTGLMVQWENRESVLDYLEVSRDVVTPILLRCRELTNLVAFSPSQTSSGQAFDTAIAMTGLLVEGNHLTPALTERILTSASGALRGESSEPLERILLDIMSLGQRMNWSQLMAFLREISDPETLRQLALVARQNEMHLPELFSAVTLSGKPAEVTSYISEFGRDGQQDLASALKFRAGGLNELLKRQHPIHTAQWSLPLTANFCWQMPKAALALKAIFYLIAGMFFAFALRSLKPNVVAGQIRSSRGFHAAWQTVFAVGFLSLVILWSEPFLIHKTRDSTFPIRLQLPALGQAIVGESNPVKQTIMNQNSLLTLLLFFVIQALIYIACLVKLSEIRRQNFTPRIKLKLLENEEHLFDAGLYIGFAGTIISLIMVSMGIIKPSLMAAYSSTSFGVIFVSIFKIFHLRPVRRKLVLDAENAAEPSAATPQSIVTPL